VVGAAAFMSGNGEIRAGRLVDHRVIYTQAGAGTDTNEVR
jgi:hypothetical protein